MTRPILKLVMAAVMSHISLGLAASQDSQVAQKPADREPANSKRDSISDLRANLKSLTGDAAINVLMKLIYSEDPEVESTVLAAMSHMTTAQMGGILSAARNTSNSHLRHSVARLALTSAACLQPRSGDSREENSHQSPMTCLGLAAKLLADSGQNSDKKVILELVRRNHYDVGLWLALAETGAVRSEDMISAEVLIRDSERPMLLRLAASAAVSKLSVDAENFALSVIRPFLAEVAPNDLASIVAGLSSRGVSGHDPSPNATTEFRNGLEKLQILQFLQSPSAETLTFEYLDANNEWVRAMLGLIAAMRWPERLLVTPLIRDLERQKLLSAVTIFHPEFLSRVRSLSSPAELDKSREQIHNQGFARVFSLPSYPSLTLYLP